MPDKIVNHFVLADGSVARYDYDGLVNMPNMGDYVEKSGFEQITPQNIEGVTVTGGNVFENATELFCTKQQYLGQTGYATLTSINRVYIQRNLTYRSFLIHLNKNTTYTANNEMRYVALLTNLNEQGESPVTYGNLVSDSLLETATTFQTGTADYCIITIRAEYAENFILSPGSTATETKTVILPEWLVPQTEEKTSFICGTGNLASGDVIYIADATTSLKKNERVVFEGNITTFNSLTIGWSTTGTNTSSDLRNYFTIDNTNIIYKGRPEYDPRTVAHGLTITDNIQIIIEVKELGVDATITLISDGNLFSTTVAYANQGITMPILIADNCTLSNCKLTWTCSDFYKKIWLFGDSYFSYDTVRWIYYLQAFGYAKNALIDGAAGEKSSQSIIAFSNLIDRNTPKFAVWCLGMNDGGDDASTPSPKWVTYRDQFLSLCEVNDVTPIFATIPTIPRINHEQKNAWVRSSGYRYIDFAKAVGADGTGAWFEGMLSSDNTHPSTRGAKALFARVLLDLPEIMIEG